MSVREALAATYLEITAVLEAVAAAYLGITAVWAAPDHHVGIA